MSDPTYASACAIQISEDWRRMRQMLRKQCARLTHLQHEAACGAARESEIQAARAHLEALRELAAAVRAKGIAAGVICDSFDRHDHSILVVDDHAPSRYCISRALRAGGYHTMEAAAGAQALELCEFASAMVLDLHLPDVHGFEVCRLVRNNPQTAELPVVHVSALHLSIADRQTSLRVGANDFMSMPLDFGQLAGRLDSLLRGRPQH